jgi:hypothetical protein
MQDHAREPIADLFDLHAVLLCDTWNVFGHDGQNDVGDVRMARLPQDL